MTTRPGFTLLEMIVVVAVLGMLMLLLNQGVAFGVRATATQVRQELRAGDMDAVDRTLRIMIAQAHPGTKDVASLRGAPTALDLVTELPVGVEPEPADVALLASGGALHLRWTPHHHAIQFGPAPPPQDLTLISGLAAAEFAYSDGRGWSATWTATALPALIRITLRFADPARRWPPIEVAPLLQAPQQ